MAVPADLKDLCDDVPAAAGDDDGAWSRCDADVDGRALLSTAPLADFGRLTRTAVDGRCAVLSGWIVYLKHSSDVRVDMLPRFVC